MSIYTAIRNIFGKRQIDLRPFPKVVDVCKFINSGCLFEVSCDVESYRVEKCGGEEEFTRLILADIKPGDVFFDIGSCVGLVAVHAAKKGARVYAFEPDPYYRSRLVNNLKLNGLDEVKIIEWAVSDSRGEVALFTDGAGGNSPSLRKMGDRMAVNVKTDTIDNGILEKEIPFPDIIKLDIEGAEILALRGMQRLLSSDKAPRAIFIEVHPEFLSYFDSSQENVLVLLKKSGYAEAYKAERSKQLHYRFRKNTRKRKSGFEI